MYVIAKVFSTDEDVNLRIESFVIVNLRSVSEKLRNYSEKLRKQE